MGEQGFFKRLRGRRFAGWSYVADRWRLTVWPGFAALLCLTYVVIMASDGRFALAVLLLAASVLLGLWSYVSATAPEGSDSGGSHSG